MLHLCPAFDCPVTHSAQMRKLRPRGDVSCSKSPHQEAASGSEDSSLCPGSALPRLCDLGKPLASELFSQQLSDDDSVPASWGCGEGWVRQCVGHTWPVPGTDTVRTASAVVHSILPGALNGARCQNPWTQRAITASRQAKKSRSEM